MVALHIAEISPKLFDSSNHRSHQPLLPAPSKISKQAKPCAIHFATFYLRSVNTSALDDPAGELLKLINSLLLNYSSSHVLQPSRRSPLETPLENLHGGEVSKAERSRIAAIQFPNSENDCYKSDEHR